MILAVNNRQRDLLCFALAGLEAGVLGGLFALGWYAAGSLLSAQPAWSIPVRLADGVFGGGIHRHGRAMAAAVGVAVQLVSAGICGLVFGLAMREPRGARRVSLLGLLCGLGWFYIGHGILLRRLGSGLYPLASPGSLLMGHLALGMILGRYPRFLSSIRPDSKPDV